MIERAIELVLWRSRLIIIVPVLVSLLLAAAFTLLTTLDAFGIIGDVLAYFNPALDEVGRTAARLVVISDIVAVVDGYLLAAILLIFGLGLYELFINKIDLAEGSEFASRLLLMKSIDDLKNRLTIVILVILVVKFFQAALRLKYDTVADLLQLAAGITLIGLALYLSGRVKPEGMAGGKE